MRGVNKFTSLFFTLLFAAGSTSYAQSSGSDKLDLKKLEDKYWSAKDSDFSVVQNRTYTKAGRPFISYSYGPMVNDAWLYGRLTNLSFGYYFSERWGMEIAMEKPASLKENESVEYLAANNGVAGNFNKVKDYTSLNFIIVPFYAKMSFFDRKILYFDMQFAGGIGKLKYENVQATGNRAQETTAYNFDFTQQLFFSEHFAVRLDVKNRWSTQTRRANIMPSQTCSSGDCADLKQQDTSYLLGITYFFGKSGQD